MVVNYLEHLVEHGQPDQITCDCQNENDHETDAGFLDGWSFLKHF